MAPANARRILDRYVLQQPIGRGGMGVVWKAEDTLLGRSVAIKEVQLPPVMPDEQEQLRRRVMREARAAARLSHHGVVTLYDVVRDEGRTYIVMELVEARTLADIVREQGPLSARQAADVGRRVLDALQAAHRRGIVHRDVKPSNVMVLADGRTKLADFGIASLSGDPELTATGTVLGSPSYMAPEQANGEASGPAADLYALGATLYFAVEGEPPFSKGAPLPTLTAVVHEQARPMRQAGPLAPVIAALLSKDPEERPAGNELIEMLDAVAEERGTIGQQLSASLSRPPWRRGRRRPWPRHDLEVNDGRTAIQPADQAPGADAAAAGAGLVGTTPMERIEQPPPTPTPTPTPTPGPASKPSPAPEQAPEQVERAPKPAPKEPAPKEPAPKEPAPKDAPSAKGAAPAGDRVAGATPAPEAAPRAKDTARDKDTPKAKAKPETAKDAPAATDAPEATPAPRDTPATKAKPEATPAATGKPAARGAGTRTGKAAAGKGKGAQAPEAGAAAAGGTTGGRTAKPAKGTRPGTGSMRPAPRPAAGATPPAGAAVPESPTAQKPQPPAPATKPPPREPAAAKPQPAEPTAAKPAAPTTPAAAKPSAARPRPPAPPKPPAPPASPVTRPEDPDSKGKRRLALLVGAVVVAAALAGSVLALATREDAPEQRAASETTTPAPAAGATTSTETTAPPTTAPPTTAPPTTAGNGAEAPPAGWKPFRNAAAGYVAAHPAGWTTRRRAGRVIDLVKPGSGTYLRIDWTPEPLPSALKAWQDYEPAFSSNKSSYKRIRMEKTDYRGLDAAIWEYTYTEGDTRLHAVNLGFVASDTRAYALNFQTTEADWKAEQPTFEAIRRSFAFRT